MKQVRVTSVNGRKIQANGKWLTAIGNRAVAVGDLVWTDGKCVYGHHSMSGSAGVIPSGKATEIPLLLGKYSFSEGSQYATYDPKNGVTVLKQGEKHDGLINTRSKFALIDNDTDAELYWKDANMDAKGNIYGIDSGQANRNGTYGVVVDNPVRMFENGNCVVSFSMVGLMEKSTADAVARVAPDSDSSAQDVTLTGKIFSAEDYWVIIHDVATAHKWIEYPPYISHGSDTCYIVRNWLVTPSSTTIIYEESVFCHSWPLEYWKSDCEINYSPPWLKEVRLPLGDGYYYILGGNPNPSVTITPHRGVGVAFLEYGGYTAYVYSPEDKLIATLSKETTGSDINAGDNISLCKLGSDKYLICIKNYGLFVAQKGELTSLDVKPYNWRLCPLKNIRQWKNAAESVNNSVDNT